MVITLTYILPTEEVFTQLPSQLCLSEAAFTYHFELMLKDLITLDLIMYGKGVFKHNFINVFRVL